MNKIRVGIVGYGNIGRGVEKAVDAAGDMELAAIFTRRNPESLEAVSGKARILPIDRVFEMKDAADVMILCGGSSNDLPSQGPLFAEHFNVVDSFDTHSDIPGYLAAVNERARKTTAIISAGWDPGIFSIMRALMSAALPDGESYTFWGRGVSQGHSSAIRSIEGVADAIQYSVPIERAVEAARSGGRPVLSARDKHLRECYVVAEEGADKAEIERKIKTMPYYFADNETVVNFVTRGELSANHSKMPHAGMVIRSGNTGENRHTLEFSLNLESNPEFTASVLAAYARAAVRMSREGIFGAKTVLDVPLYYLAERGRDELIKNLL